jgi:deoxycytidylate deaminase
MKYKKLKELSLAMAPKHPTDQRCRHFSFILHKKKILAVGFNTPKTHPINLKHNFVNKKNIPIHDLVGTHSELSAVIKLGTEDCDGLVMVNTRVNRKNEIDSSMPCTGCTSFLQTLNFKKILYTNKQGDFEELAFK